MLPSLLTASMSLLMFSFLRNLFAIIAPDYTDSENMITQIKKLEICAICLYKVFLILHIKHNHRRMNLFIISCFMSKGIFYNKCKFLIYEIERYIHRACPFALTAECASAGQIHCPLEIPCKISTWMR